MFKLINKRFFSTKIFVSNLPPYWDSNEIQSRFSKVGSVEKVQLIKNNLGLNSGKAIIEYKTEAHATQAVSTFNNTAVDNLICLARPVIEKGEVAPRKEPGILSKRVYLMNVPYDAYLHEIEGLCTEFVPIDKVVVPRDVNGLAKGYAFVYLKNAGDV